MIVCSPCLVNTAILLAFDYTMVVLSCSPVNISLKRKKKDILALSAGVSHQGSSGGTDGRRSREPPFPKAYPEARREEIEKSFFTGLEPG
jgi:hypothetical protein